MLGIQEGTRHAVHAEYSLNVAPGTRVMAAVCGIPIAMMWARVETRVRQFALEIAGRRWYRLTSAKPGHAVEIQS